MHELHGTRAHPEYTTPNPFLAMAVKMQRSGLGWFQQCSAGDYGAAGCVAKGVHIK